MCLSGYEIIEASLLEPTGKVHGTSPTPEEEAALLGEEPKLLETPKATSLLEHLEIPEPAESSEQINAHPMESTEQTDIPSTSPPPSPMPTPSYHPSQKTKKSQWGIEADPNNAGEWVCSYVQKDEWVPNWWREFISLLCSEDKCFWDIKIKGMACWQAMAFRLPAAQLERMAGGPLHPAWVCWGKGTIFPQQISKEPGITE